MSGRLECLYLTYKQDRTSGSRTVGGAPECSTFTISYVTPTVHSETFLTITGLWIQHRFCWCFIIELSTIKLITNHAYNHSIDRFGCHDIRFPSLIITVRLNKAKDLIVISTEIKKLHLIISEKKTRPAQKQDAHLHWIVHTKSVFSFLVLIVIILILDTNSVIIWFQLVKCEYFFFGLWTKQDILKTKPRK